MVADDRTIAPSPSRWRRAWEAGVRPRSRWLLPAAACGLLAAAIGEPAGPGAWGLEVRPGTLEPDGWLALVAWKLGLVWALAGGLAVAVALLTGRLGGVSTRARRRLRAPGPSPSVVGSWVVAGLVGLLVVGSLRGVLAGAARSVDASEVGLRISWSTWAARGLAVLAAALLLAAVAELVLDRHERARRLFRNRQQVRDDARASGAR